MSSRSSTSGTHDPSEDSSSGKRLFDEATYSDCKRVKSHESWTNPDGGDPESCIAVAWKAVRELDRRSLPSKDPGFPSPKCVSYSSSPRATTSSGLNLRELDRKSNTVERENVNAPRNIESTTTNATNSKIYSGDEQIPFERVSHCPPPVSASRSSINDHGDTCNSSPGADHNKSLSLSGSEHSMSFHADGPRSPDLATPNSGPDYSENSSVSFSLSPRSRTSSQVPSLLHSGEQKKSVQSSTERMRRTPLPTKKETTSTRNPFEARQEMEADTQRTYMVRSPSQAESAGSSRERSADLPLDTSLKRKSLGSRHISSESSYADSPQMKTLSIAGNYSRHRSPSATSSCDIIGTSAHSGGAQSPPSIVLSADDPGTPPRKRHTLGDDRMQVGTTRGAPPGPYTTFSSNPAVSELADRSPEAGASIVKRRGRKPSNMKTAERRHLSDNTSLTRSSDQFSLTNNPQQDNITDGPPRQLPPLDHTPRMIFQNSDPSQPYTRTPPTNQLTSIPPQLHHTLPPRPSITPPPGSPPQLLEKYRPPAVVFTIDNRAESRMLTTDVQSFIEQFTENARVITSPTQPSTPHCVYPIGVIMWQSLPEFYKWYTETTGSTEIGPLRFELIDVQWQTEKAFVVPEGNLNYFRTLKQYVWDLFWVASNLNNGPSLFQISISPFPSRGAALSFQSSPWSPVNSTNPLPRVSGPASLENIMVVAEPRTLAASTSSPRLADRSPPLSTLTHRTSNIEHILNTKEVTEVKSRAGRRSTAPANNQPAGKSSIDASSSSNRLPRPSEYIHGPPGPPMNVNRTSWDKSMLRDRAHALLVGRNDMELFSEESTVHDKLPYKTGAEVVGAIVDRNSGKGLVTVTGKGFITQNIITGPDETGDRYKEISIQAKQTCMLHGYAVVLYYKRRTSAPSQLSLQPTPKPQNPPSTDSATSTTTSSPSPIEIVVRLQIDGTGKFSAPFDKSVLRPKVNTTEFFSWFSTQTRRKADRLKFTFKDAMPEPKATEVLRGNEDHFNYMRKDVKAQCEKAKAFMPDLKEFVILVTVPGWVSPKGEEEEDW